MSTLYVVATPIGNLEDISARALRILQEVDLIACEDTRTTKKLLNHYQIKTATISYHQHSDSGKIKLIIDRLIAGANVALVSDAGTPGISDPGGKLVEAAHRAGIKVEAVPGPSAVIAALSISGMPTDKFIFHGFAPHKKGRQTMFKEIIDSEVVNVFYESVHRITKALQELSALGLDREIMVARELTKKFESTYRGTPKEVLAKLPTTEIKGEFVVIVNSK